MKMKSLLGFFPVSILTFALAGAAFANVPSPEFSSLRKSMPASVPLGTPGVTYNFEGIVALDNCSGSLVRFTTSIETDLGMVLTNGHCLTAGMPKPGVVIVDRPVTRSMTLLNPSTAQPLGTINAQKILYSTMTGTDMTIYVLKETYAQIHTRFNIQPLTLSDKYGNPGTGIEVISGYWKRGYSCRLDAFVSVLREDAWTFKDSIRYSKPGCETIGGTSGSPIISTDTKEVIGVNNTGNEDGEMCTMNNPCEVEPVTGKKTATKGNSYGQQTSWIYSCLTANRALDLSIPGCRLPQP